ECYNCKRKGHYRSECWAKGGSREGQRPPRYAPRQNQNQASLLKRSKGQEIVTRRVRNTEMNVGLNTALTELYDSGASSHMSPFRDHFTTFQSIPPRPII
ncbi:hypothetical protein BC834DRAFT_786380, partial [Gloeopeniophorella convolvens]